jgi:hypothetical protein
MTDPIDTATGEIAQAQSHLDAATAALHPDVPAPVVVTTPAELDAALASSAPVITLALTFRDVRPLTIPRPVTLQGAAGVGRQTREAPLPAFLGGIRNTRDDVTLVGLEVRHTNPLTDIVVNTGARFLMDRCRVLGDPTTGAKRGIAANGRAQTIVRCHVADIWQPKQDTQAIAAWDCGPGLVIDDCYLSAAGQAVMLGGADPATADGIPRDVTIRNSTLTKDPAWFALTGGVQIKCALEFKNAIGVRVTTCLLEYAGTSQGQGAYLIVATPRNQSGHAPFSTVQDVVISNCTGRFAAGILNALGSDNNFPSGPLADFTITDCAFSDIDPTGITGGPGRLFMLDRAPVRLTLDGVQVAGGHLAALGYLSGPPPIGFVARRLTLPPSKYGWKLDAGKSGRAAWLAYMVDAVLDETVI